MPNDTELLDAAEAFHAEFKRWFWRHNDMMTTARYEVCRYMEDDDIAVMAWSTGMDTAVNETEEMGSIAAMKSALAKITG